MMCDVIEREPLPKIEWELARVIMENRDNGQCLVKDWEREEIDNPHVAQALRQARAVLQSIAEMAIRTILERKLVDDDDG